MSRYYASTILMVAPYGIQFNTETSNSNQFQINARNESVVEYRKKALAEFKKLKSELLNNGIEVLSIDEEDIDTELPDAVFPNNWICTLPNGSVVLFPMLATNRRSERRKSIIDIVLSRMQCAHADLIDMSPLENEGKYLEGTGSIVFDHKMKIAFASISERTHETALNTLCNQIDYESFIFTAVDDSDHPIYHTNVLMAILNTHVIICLDTIKDNTEKSKILEYCKDAKKELINISLEQMKMFAGNVIQLVNKEGKIILLMSASAREAFTEKQVLSLEATSVIVSSPINTIEMLGGGSTRCMVAEIFC